MFSGQESRKKNDFLQSMKATCPFMAQLKCRPICHESAIRSEADLNRTSSEVSV